MPKNEDGEFELVLGNRQLLSVFFIVIVLFGLFFVMGYILGRPVSVPPEATVARKERPLVVESPARNLNPAPPAAKAEPERIASPPEKAQAPPEQPKPEEPVKAEPKPEPVKAPPERKAEKTAPPVPASNEPASGTYLQLAATTQHEANLVAEKLRKKGFKTVVAEVPEKHGLFRVLVGPLGDGNVNRTKTDLQSSGFPGDKAIKRTY